MEFTKEMHEMHDADMQMLGDLLKTRRATIELLKTMPKRFLRNHKTEFSEPISIHSRYDYYFNGLQQSLYGVMRLLQEIEGEVDADEYNRVEKIALSSTYKTTEDVESYLQEYIDNYESPEEEGTGYLAMVESGELQVDGEDERGTLLYVDSHAKMRKAFSDSFWCFSRFGSSDDWDSYAPEGYVYVWITPEEKYVLLMRNGGEVYDWGNSPVHDIDAFEVLRHYDVA